jgi:hypothetical protein
MPAFDASSMLYAWDNYPENQFPPLWNWIEAEINAGRIEMCAVAYDEVGHKSPDCQTWLQQRGLVAVAITNEIVQEANRVKNLLGIVNDNYHPDGVDENDLLIIAMAHVQGLELVSQEHQPIPPANPLRSKIPTVCRMPTVALQCMNFIDYLKRSGTVFR